jgi:hypothetical protein
MVLWGQITRQGAEIEKNFKPELVGRRNFGGGMPAADYSLSNIACSMDYQTV